jgi:hypothetical protein
MKLIKSSVAANGTPQWEGKPGVRRSAIFYRFTTVDVLLQAITDISNGILRDGRVFHMDCPDWTEKYNRQGNLLFLLH